MQETQVQSLGEEVKPTPVFLLEKSHGQRSLAGCRVKSQTRSSTHGCTKYHQGFQSTSSRTQAAMSQEFIVMHKECLFHEPPAPTTGPRAPGRNKQNRVVCILIRETSAPLLLHGAVVCGYPQAMSLAEAAGSQFPSYYTEILRKWQKIEQSVLGGREFSATDVFRYWQKTWQK